MLDYLAVRQRQYDHHWCHAVHRLALTEVEAPVERAFGHRDIARDDLAERRELHVRDTRVADAEPLHDRGAAFRRLEFIGRPPLCQGAMQPRAGAKV